MHTAREILSYFLRNPRTVDDLEGLVRWRLLEMRVEEVMNKTDRGLKLLVKQGYLAATRQAGSAEHFHLNEAKRSEAERFVAGRLEKPR